MVTGSGGSYCQPSRSTCGQVLVCVRISAFDKVCVQLCGVSLAACESYGPMTHVYA